MANSKWESAIREIVTERVQLKAQHGKWFRDNGFTWNAKTLTYVHGSDYDYNTTVKQSQTSLF